MKKLLFVLIALTTSIYAQTVTVTGERVSLRAAPKLNAVLLDRTSLHDQLELADNSDPDWVGVRPPESVDLWVHRDYLQDDVVLPAKLNVRSGPSLSHEVVGVVQRGDKLTVRGDVDGWLKIAPPSNCTVWISRKYTDIAVEAPEISMPEPVVVAVKPANPVVQKGSNLVIKVESPKPVIADVVETPVVLKVTQPMINEILVAAAEMPNLPKKLVPDTEKEQGVTEQFSGILQPANDLLYKLVDPKFESIVICYVRGNRTQMETFAGRALVLSGKAYWAAGLETPFLVPELIESLSTEPVE